MTIHSRKRIKPAIVSLLCLFVLAFQLYHFIKGPWQSCFESERIRNMFLELVLFSIVMFVINCFFKGRTKIAFIFLCIIVVAYFHQTMLDMLVAVAYFCIIVFTGSVIAWFLLGEAKKDGLIFWGVSLLLGLDLVCIVVAALSGLHRYTGEAVWCIIGGMAVFGMIVNRDILCVNADNRVYDSNVAKNIFFAFLGISILLQIARVGLQGDYDACWYGLRSASVLANSEKGIYEDLKLVGFVYLYPKGFETILLPLTKSFSWNAQLIFSELLRISVVAFGWKLVKELYGSKAAYIVGTVVLGIPALMNMAVTVKPDVITVLFQVSALLFAYLGIKRRSDYMYMAITCLASSLCFKITSVLFSSIILLAILPFMLSLKVRPNKKNICLLLIGILTLGVIWGRTYLLTGSPIIAFVGKIVEAFKIEIKYPYAIVRGINHSPTGSIIELCLKIIENLYGYFVLPLGEKFNHVVIAWGTAIPIMITFIGIVYAKNRIDFKRHFKWIWCVVLLYVSMIFGLSFVSQADGNYFLLFYVLITLLIGGFVLKTDVHLKGIMYVFAVFGMVFSSMTNWAGAVGFTEVKAKNMGYIDRAMEMEDINIKDDEKEIYSYINAKSDNRVIAATLVINRLLSMRCIAELWRDIEVSNPRILQSSEDFEEYVKKCNFDYIYIDNGLVNASNPAQTILKNLIERGAVKDIVYAEDSALFVLGEAGQNTDVEEMVNQFLMRKGEFVKVSGIHEDGWTERESCFELRLNKNREVALQYYSLAEQNLDIWVDGNLIKKEEMHVGKGETRLVFEAGSHTVRLISEYEQELSDVDKRRCSFLFYGPIIT